MSILTSQGYWDALRMGFELHDVSAVHRCLSLVLPTMTALSNGSCLVAATNSEAVD